MNILNSSKYLALFATSAMLAMCTIGEPTADDLRREFDSTLFSNAPTAYDSNFKAELMKTEAYGKYKITKNADSVKLYLMEAEKVTKKKLNIVE